MLSKSGILLVFSLVFLCLAIGQSQENIKDPPLVDDEAKKKFVLEKLSEGLRNEFRSKAMLKIDDLERFAGLAPGDLKKARVLSKGAIRDIAEEFNQSISGAVKRSIREIAGTTFSINGKEFTFDGEEAEKEFLTVRFNFFRTRGQWQVRRPGGGSGGSYRSSKLPFKIEDESSWRRSISSISDDQLKDYEQFAEKRANQQLSSAITANLSNLLLLSAEQKVQMHEFISKHAERDLDFSLFENAELYLDAKVLESTPDFLTDLQKQKWAQVIK